MSTEKVNLSKQELLYPVVEKPVKTVVCKIAKGTVIETRIPEEVQDPKNKFQMKKSLTLQEISFACQEGTIVCLGNNTYVIVSDFCERSELTCSRSKTFMTMLASGTKISVDGIPLTIAEDMGAMFPSETKIVVAAGTKLQQIDADVQLTLGKDTVFTLAKPQEEK